MAHRATQPGIIRPGEERPGHEKSQKTRKEKGIMEKKFQMKYITIVLILCLSALLSMPSLSAQPWQKDNPLPAAKLSPEQVTVRDMNWDTYQAEALAAGSDLAWVHGSSLHLENEGTLFTLKHFGFASEVTILQTAAKTGNWVHFAVPTPTFIDGKRASLQRVIIAFDSAPSDGLRIDRVDVWDASNRILSMQVSWGNAGLEVKSLEFPQPPFVFSGVGISMHIVNCSSPEFCNTQRIRFTAAGAEFTR